MNVTAEIPRDILIAAANSAISREIGELDAMRAAWVKKRLGKRRGFLWGKVWTDDDLHHIWARDHRWIPESERSRGLGWGNYRIRKLIKLRDIHNMAENKNIGSFRLDHESLAMLGLT